MRTENSKKLMSWFVLVSSFGDVIFINTLKTTTYNAKRGFTAKIESRIQKNYPHTQHYCTVRAP